MTKRKNQETFSDNSTSAKRYRHADFDVDEKIPKIQPAVNPRLNTTYGQRGAFPGLDDTAENEKLFYGPACDGLEYLEMVRYVLHPLRPYDLI